MATPGTVVKGSATKEECEQYISMIAPSCQKWANQNGVKICSFLIAQCCCEGGWGFSNYAVNFKNILGIGCWPGHTGKSYASWDACIQDYFVSTVLGKSEGIKKATTLDEYYQAFVDSHYYGQETSSNAQYYSMLKSVINKYNLTQYDNGNVVAGGGLSSGTDSTGAPVVAVSYETKSRVIETANVVEGGGDSSWKTFYRFNMSSPTFISQMLTPYAVSAKTGQSGYRLWFDDYSPVPEDNCTVYFKPDSYNIHYDRSLLEDLDKHYVFQTGTGVDSNVIEFNPSCSGILTAVTGGGEVDATVLDAIKNEIIHDFHNQFKDEYAPKTGDSDDIPDDKVTIITASSYSPSELESMAASLWYNMRNIGFDADMVIVGDPELEVQSICSVLVLKKNGLPHYTSGTYLITRIVDDITAGTYQSTLSLVRNAMDMSVNESGGLDITLSQNTLYTGIGSYNGSSDSSSAGGGSASNADVEKAVQWAIDVANNPEHGYDWGSRNGPDYDCSSLVYHAFKQAGFNVMGGNTAGTTCTMRGDFTKAGFTWHPGMGNSVDGLQRGDILLDESSHVEIYIGNNQNVGAHISETGKPYCGQKGDQTGHEIDVGKWYAHPWDGTLRYGG